jgi:hypothetical protein
LVFANTFLLKYNLKPIMIKNHEALIKILVSFYTHNNKNILIKEIKRSLK